MKQYKPGQIYKRLSDLHSIGTEYFYIISVTETHIKYYYLDEPNDIINRPVHTITPDNWIFVQ